MSATGIQARLDASRARRVLLLPLLGGLITACGSGVASGSATQPPVSTAAASNPAPTLASRAAGAPAYAALGASETFGVGAAPTSAAYAYRIRDALHLDAASFADVGIPAATLADGYQTELTNALAVRPTVCTVFFGVNDVRAGVPLAQFSKDLTDLVTTLRRASAEVLIIGMPDLSLLPAVRAQGIPGLARVAPAWNAEMLRVAMAVGARFFAVDAFSSEIATHPEYLASDGLHPSNAGHARLAEIILAALRVDGLIG